MSRAMKAIVFSAVLGTATLAAGQPTSRSNPNTTRALEHYSAAWEYMRSESFERAAAEFQLATDFEPKMALAWYGLGRAHLALQKYQQALLNLRECHALFTAVVSKRFNNQMDADRARRDQLMELEEMRLSYTKGPQTNQSNDMLRLIETQIQFTNDAIQRGTNIDIIEPIPAFVSLSLGSAYFRTGNLPEAERAYKAALRSDGGLGAAHNNLAVIYMMQERFDDANEHLLAAERAGLSIDPDLKERVLSGRPIR